MLIVNADDFGASPTATDRTVEVLAAGRISSASAMVWMPDTHRCAQIAQDYTLPLGLHLNLTLPFGVPDVPPRVRARQLELTKVISKQGWREPVADGPLETSLRAAISDQLAEYRRVFGEPTHIDGHHHVHVQPSILRALPRDFPIRPVLRAPRRINDPASSRDRFISENFRAPDVSLALENVHPALGGNGLEILEVARDNILEVMVHPQLPAQFEALMSAEWKQAIAHLPLGSYRDIPSVTDQLDSG